MFFIFLELYFFGKVIYISVYSDTCISLFSGVFKLF